MKCLGFKILICEWLAFCFRWCVGVCDEFVDLLESEFPAVRCVPQQYDSRQHRLPTTLVYHLILQINLYFMNNFSLNISWFTPNVLNIFSKYTL